MKTLYTMSLAALLALPSWSAEVGTVRLPLTEYQRLLRDAKTPEVTNPPPLAAGWVNGDYALTVRGETIRLITTLDAVSWSDDWQQLTLPELGAVYTATFVGGTGSIHAKDGVRRLNLRGRGAIRLQLESVPTHGRDGGAAWITFGVADASANLLAGTLPEGNANVSLTGGVLNRKTTAPGAVELVAQLERGATARLEWALAAREAPNEPLVATASLARLYVLGDDQLTLAGHLEVEVLRGALDRVAITAPADFRPISAVVADNSVRSFERDPGDPSSVLLILGDPVTSGAVRIFWSLNAPFRLTGGIATLPEVELPGFPRAESVVAVISRKPIVVTSAEAASTGYDRIDESDLPTFFRAIIDRPVLFAARRRAGGSPALALHLGVFPDAVSLDGVIDRADLLSVVKSDGRRVDRTRLELQSRESVLRLPLPDGAQVWSVMLDGSAVRPLTEEGKLLVPLGRGRASLGTRILEYVTNTTTAATDNAARDVAFALPGLPLPATLVSWQLWLPDGFRYRIRGGTLTETLQDVPLTANVAPLFVGGNGSRPAGHESHRSAVGADMVSGGQVPAQAPPPPPGLANLSTATILQNTFAAGVASIPVELPTSGKLFALDGRLLIDQGMSVELERKREKKRK